MARDQGDSTSGLLEDGDDTDSVNVAARLPRRALGSLPRPGLAVGVLVVYPATSLVPCTRRSITMPKRKEKATKTVSVCLGVLLPYELGPGSVLLRLHTQ